MARSHSVLRRYTPPTCTLEVIARDSALSRWVGKPVVNDLRFQLSLDDPKLEREDWVVVQGDRTQLAALSEAVSHYVQHFLGVSQGYAVPTLVEADAAIATLPTASFTNALPTNQLDNPLGISLHPKGLLSHEIHWGELATAETGTISQISTLQLFDLANALDDYSSDVLDLPDRGQRGWGKPVPNWAQIAAVVLVAVGLSTSAIRLLDGSSGVTPMASQGASSSDQKIATQLPPAVVDKATPAVISNQKLPPPPVGATPVPQPGMPTVITPKKPSPSPASGTVSPNVIAAYPVPVVPGAPTIITGGTVGAVPQPAPAKSAASVAKQPSAETFSDQQSPSAAIAARRGATAESNQTASAFDTIPQVAEVRTYFQQKWKPPEGLNQILEYSLQLNADGSIQNIAPLRQASGDYIDRTGMPLLGDPFVSPLKGRQSAKIRLVLEPSGEVRAFLEE